MASSEFTEASEGDDGDDYDDYDVGSCQFVFRHACTL